jgi:hypothetical protein
MLPHCLRACVAIFEFHLEVVENVVDFSEGRTRLPSSHFMSSFTLSIYFFR